MMIFIMRGASNSGKDTFCKEHFESHCVISSDELRLKYLNNINDQTMNQFIFDKVREILSDRLRFGCSYTVINATNLKLKDCKDYLDIADEYGAGITFISIDPPEDTGVLIERGKNRVAGASVPEDVILRHVQTYWSQKRSFEDLAISNSNIKWIRISQDWEVVDEI